MYSFPFPLIWQNIKETLFWGERCHSDTFLMNLHFRLVGLCDKESLWKFPMKMCILLLREQRPSNNTIYVYRFQSRKDTRNHRKSRHQKKKAVKKQICSCSTRRKQQQQWHAVNHERNAWACARALAFDIARKQRFSLYQYAQYATSTFIHWLNKTVKTVVFQDNLQLNPFRLALFSLSLTLTVCDATEPTKVTN